MHAQQQSRLLQLPPELQLLIFEFAVVENEPLLVNCGCDSSYPRGPEAWAADLKLWKEGEKKPPLQPGLTQTCTMIRGMTLPMFYQQNVFRAHYCHQADFHMVLKWLKLMGAKNRGLLKDFGFWDLNPRMDNNLPHEIMMIKRSEVFSSLAGSMETIKVEGCCCHRVTFGEEADDYYELIPMLFENQTSL